MATTTVDMGNVYITTGTVSSNTITHNDNECVRIETTKLDQNYDSNMPVIAIAISKGDRGEEPYSRAIDLKRANESISIQGYLIEESTERAITKKNNLLTLAKKKSSLTIVWGQGNYRTIWQPDVVPYGVFITKMMFTETAGQIGIGFSGDAPPERSIAIQMTVVRGKDM